MEENKKVKTKCYSPSRSGFVFGVLLMLVGGLFLATNFGVLPNDLKRIFLSWEMLLIVIGIINLFKRHFFSGLSLITIGGFFLVPRLAVIYPDIFSFPTTDFTHTYWPVLLIIAGILIILQWIFKPRKWDMNNYASVSQHYHHKHDHKYDYEIRGTRGAFDRNAVFGNIEEIILDPEFKGGEMNAVFGGIVLDLRRTSLPEGNTELEINAVFGGIKIYVPEDWHVETHLTSVFGGFKDYRDITEYDKVDHSKKLILIGSCVFGGGEIRN